MPHATLEARRAYYRRNPEPFKARTRAYKKAHRAEISAKYRNYRTKPFGRAQYLLEVAKRRALKKGIAFDLTRDWVMQGIERGCAMSGIVFVLTAGEDHHPYAPSIDRIDSSEGYTKDNCRVILWCLNTALGSWGEHLAFAAWRAVLGKSGYGCP